MLDTDTKRRIDTCRDILVGKVPDPKSQVEQITIALIYKFMDDMDAEAEELGGDRTFFAGDYEKYGWAKLMAPNMGGFDVLALYSEAIQKMNENPGIPSLFRDIFKNAYLPYRDPETLRSFLKEINGFTYDHSERLGDAFEYLLSVLGSQGDAGQFRTPRHIIDFIVEIIDPKKDDTILDPACGTAGFLISAWKYILKANTKARGGDLLTPDERRRLVANIRGYDISPDMVRLSLVNMYLHGFTDPHIDEYDTLTSQDRWNEYADVILANPPFMSPKGGIKPHKRFSIQAKRSEVLFVDYMAEHLSPTGRAAIIVPEGIIFQSQTAYAELRKMLVENSLVAVVSLPAGVFQPYSAVKTSILILDKTLARQTQTVAFFKVENDGFGLGAQRRPIDKNDLPQVQAELNAFLHALRSSQSIDEKQLSFGLVVAKEKIAANGDYNLSGERYRENGSKNTKFPTVKIGDVCSTSSGGTPQSCNAAYYEGGTIPWLRSGEVAQGEVLRSEMFITKEGLKNSSAKLFPPNTVLVAMYGATAGEVGILRFESATNQAVCGVMPDSRLIPEFLYLLLKANKPALIRLAGGGAQPNISQKIIRDFEIPLPPLEVQRDIVAEIKGYQKVIDGARIVLDNYRPNIPIHPEWPMVAIGDLVSINNGYVLSELPEEGKIACIKVSDMNLPENQREIVTSSHWLPASDRALLPIGTVVFPKRGAAIATNKKRITKIPCLIDNNCMGLTVLPNAELDSGYLFNFLLGFDLSTISNSAGIALINNGDISSVQIPLPSLATQQQIVTEIETEQVLVNANRELVARFEKKINATLARVWGEDKPISAEA